MRPFLKLAVIGLLLALGWLAYALVQMTDKVERKAHANHDAATESMIENACLNYMMEYNQFPPATDNKTLAAALLGDNPRHIVFLALTPSQLNADHEIIDQWGTPFRVSLQGGTGVRIVSAGPDKVFGTSDDVISNGISENSHP